MSFIQQSMYTRHDSQITWLLEITATFYSSTVLFKDFFYKIRYSKKCSSECWISFFFKYFCYFIKSIFIMTQFIASIFDCMNGIIYVIQVSTVYFYAKMNIVHKTEIQLINAFIL